MSKKALSFLALLLSFGFVAASCGEDAADVVDDATEAAEDVADDATEVAEDVVDEAGEAAEEVVEEADDMVDEAGEAAEEVVEEADDMVDEKPATVVDVALSDDNFSTLVTAVTEAGLVETLQGEGPFTVFAPTNEAFEALLADLDVTADELLAREDLSEILTYHVVPGAISAADALAADGTELTTVNGDTIAVTVVDGAVMVDGATVTATDLEAGNGVVHVIDSVILPG